jgi:S-adenosylmethionine decarboxylase proenzyme
MRTLGKHVIVEAINCNSKLLDDFEAVKKVMYEAVEVSGATSIGDISKKFDPNGVTVLIGIEESHISIHTWPEYGYAAIDAYTCGPTMDPEKAADHIVKRLEGIVGDKKIIKRGIPDGEKEETMIPHKL